MSWVKRYLEGGDLRSTGKVDELIKKITINKTELLQPYKQILLEFLDAARNKELKWHIA